MRERLSIPEFVARLRGRPKEEARLDIEREKADADRFAARSRLFRKGVQAGPTQDQWRAYGDALRSFLHFVYNSNRPVNPAEGYNDFRPLVESWVKAGELPAKALGAFDSAPAAGQ